MEYDRKLVKLEPKPALRLPLKILRFLKEAVVAVLVGAYTLHYFLPQEEGFHALKSKGEYLHLLAAVLIYLSYAVATVQYSWRYRLYFRAAWRRVWRKLVKLF